MRACGTRTPMRVVTTADTDLAELLRDQLADAGISGDELTVTVDRLLAEAARMAEAANLHLADVTAAMAALLAVE